MYIWSMSRVSSSTASHKTKSVEERHGIGGSGVIVAQRIRQITVQVQSNVIMTETKGVQFGQLNSLEGK